MHNCLFLPFLCKIQQAERLVWLVQDAGLEWVPNPGVALDRDKFNSFHKRFNDNYNSLCSLRTVRKY